MKLRLVPIDQNNLPSGTSSRMRHTREPKGGGVGQAAPKRKQGRGGQVEVMRQDGVIQTLDLDAFTRIPATYVMQVQLDNQLGAQSDGAADLRPELFLLRRISWASTNDIALGFAGADGRTVEVTWGDEFTKFMGSVPGLLSAVFGDSNGFLDLTREILFNGSQRLNCELSRVLATEDESRIDIVLHGTGLLPLGMQASGSL